MGYSFYLHKAESTSPVRFLVLSSGAKIRNINTMVQSYPEQDFSFLTFNLLAIDE
jgi:hypothetical protein